MSKRTARAAAKRLHNEVIERLVAKAQERLAQEALRRRFESAPIEEKRK